MLCQTSQYIMPWSTLALLIYFYYEYDVKDKQIAKKKKFHCRASYLRPLAPQLAA